MGMVENGTVESSLKLQNKQFLFQNANVITLLMYTLITDEEAEYVR